MIISAPRDTRTLRVGLAQLAPAARDLAANVARVVATIDEHPGDDLLVFPELFLSGLPGDGYDDLAVAVDGPEVGALCAAAARRGTAVLVGAPVRGEHGIRNVALAIGADGAIAGAYAKTHLWSTEGDRVVAGRAIAPIALGGVRVGAMVCFDVEFPEVARVLALSGAELLITIAANMEPFGLDHATFVRARALESNRAHVYVNRVGTENGKRYVGESCVVAADGTTLACAPAGEAIVHVDVPLGDTRGDPRLAYPALRRPELYGALTAPDESTRSNLCAFPRPMA